VPQAVSYVIPSRKESVVAGDYIPAADAQFDTWQANFVSYVNAHLADLGLDAPDVVDLNDAAATWTSDYPARIAAWAAAQAARQAKDGARAGFEGAIRPLVRRLQASPDLDDAERTAMGITVPDRDITGAGSPRTARKDRKA
jgi:hypothetical protein